MPKTLLAFDTSAAHVAAALLSDGKIQAVQFEEMLKGQAEALFSILESILPSEGWAGLDGIVVGTGPGNFTGIRISISAARGLAMSLKIPAIGVSNFDLMREGEPADHLFAALPAPRNQAYVQEYKQGVASDAPFQVDLEDMGDLSFPKSATIIGSHAEAIAKPFGAKAIPKTLENIPQTLAQIGARRMDETDHPRPAPLYVRAPDASLPKEPPVVILP